MNGNCGRVSETIPWLSRLGDTTKGVVEAEWRPALDLVLGLRLLLGQFEVGQERVVGIDDERP